MKFFVSVGEPSGDLHLSYLVNAIKNENKDISFVGMAGDHCRKAGVEIIQEIKDIAVMGFWEAIKKYSFLKKKIDEYIVYIEKNEIENVILVDYGGFNLKLLKALKEKLPNVKVYYYIPPKVWVWGKKRVKTLKLVDEIVVIFPWEVDFYKEYNMDVTYYGNPFIDLYPRQEKLGDKILLLPGSRRSEIGKLLPIYLEVAKELKDEKFLLKLASKEQFIQYNEEIKNYKNIQVEYEMGLIEAAKNSKYAIAASGTVVLELAVLGLPGVVVYKIDKLSELIGRYILKLKYVSLPNLALDREVYRELLQQDCTKENIINEINKIDNNPQKFQDEITEIIESLGGKDIINQYAEFFIQGDIDER